MIWPKNPMLPVAAGEKVGTGGSGKFYFSFLFHDTCRVILHDSDNDS